jgi:hypothetical protein
MKIRSAAWAAILFLFLIASSCSRSTPGNTPSSQAQPASQTQPTTAENTPQPLPAPAAGGPTAPEKPAAKPQSQAPQRAAPPPAPPPPIVLPAGTVLTVRVDNAIGTKTSHVGDKFSGSIVQPVVQAGRTAIPAGSLVSGTVEQSKQGGKIKGSSTLALRLTSVTVKGVPYPISTGSFLHEGKGKGSRTAKIGVGSAAGGALIGGIAGGGKGALIGSVVGAGAGITGSAFTGNKELSIPAESVLQFQLAQPLKLMSGDRGPVSNNPNEQQ